MTKQVPSLSPQKSRSFQKIFDLQSMLLNLTEANYEDLKKYVGMHFTKNQEVVEYLAHEIAGAAAVRYNLSSLYAMLMSAICRAIKPNSHLSFFKPAFWNEFKKAETKAPNFFFIHQCFLTKAFSIHEIIEQIKNWPNDTKNNSVFDFFLYFAPDISQLDIDAYFDIYNDIESKRNFTKSQKQISEKWEKLRENKWQELTFLIEEGCHAKTLKHDLKYDQVEHLKDLSSVPSFRADEIMTTHAYDPPLLQSSPLLIHYCAYYGSVKCLRHLMHKGANIKSEDGQGLNILDFAIVGGNQKIIDSIIKHSPSIQPTQWFLIKYHLDSTFNVMAQTKQLSGKSLIDAFHLCIKFNNLAILNALIKSGINVNMVSSGGQTPLMEAIENKQTMIVKYFISFHGLDIYATNEAGNTVLHLACESRNYNAAKMIIDRTGKNLVNVASRFSKDIPLHIAAEIDHIPMIQLLLASSPSSLNAINFEGATPIMISIQNQNLESVLVFLKNKEIDLSVQDSKGRSALRIAVELGNLQISQEIGWAYPPAINITDKFNQTPLHISCQQGNYEMTKFLVRLQNADIGIIDNNGKTPIMYAQNRATQELFKFAEMKEKA